jgi:hypothetical protein
MIRYVGIVATALSAAACSGSSVGDERELATSRSAIINGTDDGDHHPQVCAIKANLQSATGRVVQRCSGVLIAPDVVLVAGHCTDALPTMWFNETVTCDPVVTASSETVSFTPVTHPQFSRQLFMSQRAAGLENYDVGVLLLHEPIENVRPAELPRMGFLDDLYGDCANYEDCGPFATAVGYGAVAVGVGRNTRREVRADFALLHDVYVSFHEEGGVVCFGDSGSPAFLGATGRGGGGTVLGIASGAVAGAATTCEGLAAWHRVDTALVAEFLANFVP